MKTALALLSCLLASSAAHAADASKPFTQTGTASWYGNEFKGHKTANGERYNPDSFTAAHRKLPFGTMVRVTNLRNSKCVVVRINNRGPYIRGRIIDVSRAAAAKLEMFRAGVVRVRIEEVSRSTPPGP